VAAAIGGLALGGGCELAMGAHYRVLADTPKAALGLPESLVGLLPGGGGTQRLPRLTGMSLALPVLLEGGRLTGRAAMDAGLVDALVPPGEELAAAELWVLSAAEAVQPWDRPGWQPPDLTNAAAEIETARGKILSETLGHYPAPLAILDCVAQGYAQPMDTAIRTEMTLFARLIQRPEPRNMIATMFLGKLDYERRIKANALPAEVERVTAMLAERLGGHATGVHAAALAEGGFVIPGQRPAPVQPAVAESYWFDTPPSTAPKQAILEVLGDIAAAASPFAAQLGVEEKRLVDYALVSQAGYPAYLGGPFAFQPGH
jgi:3-hydroxyacyl-CoA dehydrogenase/enoyl-CoA hydratase/3-hydroxybutyryl-CoA epimerase